MKTLDELIPLLHPSKIMASKIINVDLKGKERLVGLSVWCNPLHHSEIEERIRKIIGDGFRIFWLQTASEIIIEPK